MSDRWAFRFVRMTSFWESPAWLRYEVAYGDAPGTRARLLASADWQTHVIDLTPDEATLWRGIRKSYKSLIRRSEREYELASLSPLGILTTCRRLHWQEAGRDTRPFETWRLMSDWIEQGCGFCVCTLKASAPIAFAYFAVWESWAYYFSSATLEPNVHHALIWTAMKALKARGVQQLEMGWQGQATDPKGQQIEFHKRGYGGICIPVREAGTQWADDISEYDIREHLDRLDQRRKWLEVRMQGKQRIGWEVVYDASEHGALVWALTRLGVEVLPVP